MDEELENEPAQPSSDSKVGLGNFELKMEGAYDNLNEIIKIFS